MADKELGIDITTTADARGVQETAEALDDLQNAAREANAETEKATALNDAAADKNDGLADSLQEAAEAAQDVAQGSKAGAKGLANMGQGALQAAYFFDDMQYGIRGVMNNIPSLVMGLGGGAGLAGALSLAVLAGSKLYDYLNKASIEAAENAKKHAAALQDVIDQAQKAEVAQNNEEALRSQLELAERIAETRARERDAVAASVKEQQRLLDLQSKILDEADRAALARTQSAYYRGDYGDGPEARRRLEEDQAAIRQNAANRKRDEEEARASANVTAASETLRIASEALAEAKSRAAVLENSGILTNQQRQEMEGQNAAMEQSMLESFMDVFHLLRNKAEQTGSFGLGRISSDDARAAFLELMKNGMDASKLKSSWWQDANAGNAGRTLQQLFAQAIELSGIKHQYDQIQKNKEALKKSDNALYQQGADLNDRGAAYENNDKALADARQKVAEATQDVSKAEENLRQATNKQEDIRKLNAARAERQQAEEQAQKNKLQQARKEELEQAQEQQKLQQERQRLESNLQRAQEQLKTQEKQLSQAAAAPLGKDSITANALKRGKLNQNKLDAVNNALKAPLQEALADGEITKSELQGLAQTLGEAFRQQGVQYKGGLQALTNYLAQAVSQLQQQAAQLQAAQKKVDSIGAQLKTLQNQQKRNR